jgi:transcriptional regulator with XRE-family HTH domain
MESKSLSRSTFGRRLRQRREALGLAQEKVGVAIGLDESSARARISRYELGVHEPPIRTAQLIAAALNVPLPYLYCDEDEIAELLLLLTRLAPDERGMFVQDFLIFEVKKRLAPSDQADDRKHIVLQFD